MRDVGAPLFVRLGNRGKGQQVPVPGALRNILVDNIIAIGSYVTSSVTGLPSRAVENIMLSNMLINVKGGEQTCSENVPERPGMYPEATMFGKLPAYGFYFRHVVGLSIRNIRINPAESDVRPKFVFDDVSNLVLDNPHQ